jgi:hypothetical protein
MTYRGQLSSIAGYVTTNKDVIEVSKCVLSNLLIGLDKQFISKKEQCVVVSNSI